MDVGGGWLTPVVIPGAPPIKMDQQLPFAVDFLYGGNTDQGWILSVHCLELHASFKLTNTCIAIRGFQLRLKKKKKKKKKSTMWYQFLALPCTPHLLDTSVHTYNM